MKNTILAVLFFLFIFVKGSLAKSELPNVVLFFVDDLGYGDVGFNGHPTTRTPNIDRLAANGKILSTWYSGYPVCSASRAALMTGRQPTRIGVPGVFSATVNVGLPLNETTVAQQFKQKGYSTGICGKWHLGQREMFLPASRGFDTYLGIPYSDDMGTGGLSSCASAEKEEEVSFSGKQKGYVDVKDYWSDYAEMGFLDQIDAERLLSSNDPGGSWLPLVYQTHDENDKVNTTILEQPLDFTTLAEKYNNFAHEFVKTNHDEEKPFFLYMPFSHVHTTNPAQPALQYASCGHRNQTVRGPFGDALYEVDWIVGNIVKQLEELNIADNTLILFSSDNGPWMIKNQSGGSVGLFYGRSAGYWNVGKGSTWEGGIREPAFAYWPGVISPGTKSQETISSMDMFPTLSKLIGVDLPKDLILDGKDASDIIFDKGTTKTKHEFLFFYGGGQCSSSAWKKVTGGGPSAVRFGDYKAHFATAPGIGGCTNCKVKCYCTDPFNNDNCAPLIFNVAVDPSEAYPLEGDEYEKVSEAIISALRNELNTFQHGPPLVPPKDLPGEGKDKYGICCDRSKQCECDHYSFVGQKL